MDPFSASDGATGRERLVRRALIRASLFFAVLLAVNVSVVALLLFRDFDKQAILASLREAQTDALALAEGIGRVGAPAGGFDYFRIFEREQVLTRVLNEFMARREVIRHVEVRDAQGNTVLRFRRGETRMLSAPEGLPFGFAPRGPEGPTPPSAGTYVFETPVRERVVRVPVPGGPEGATLDVSLAEDALESEAREVRRSLMVKLGIGAGISLLLLVAAFAWVLGLIRKTRRLEAEAHMADRLAYVGTLASGLAHEIRNPLNAMSMNLQMLEEELGDLTPHEETMSLLVASRSEVKRLELLVQDFLAYARPGTTSMEVQPLGPVVEDVLSFLRPQFQEHQVELEYHPSGKLPPVALAVDPFRQALLNILQNALQVSSQGTTVTVATEATGDGGASVEVRDRGRGIPPDRLARIFQVFYSERPGGTGLGLPIAQRVLESHGGRIEIDSEVGHGTTVRLVLPAARGKEGKESVPAEQVAVGESP